MILTRRKAKAAILAVRINYGIVLLLSALIALLAYIPFTYFTIVKDPIVEFVSVFLRIQPLLFLITSSFVCWLLADDLRIMRTRRLVIGFIAFNVAAAIWLLSGRGLSALPNDYRSLIWGLIALFLLVWLAAIDFEASEPSAERLSNSSRTSFAAALGSTLFVLIVYGIPSIFRLRHSMQTISVSAQLLLAALVISSVSLPFLFVTAGVSLIEEVCERFRLGEKSQALLAMLVPLIVFDLFFRRVVLAGLGQNGRWVDWWTAAFALELAIFVGGTLLRLRSVAGVSANKSRSMMAAMLGLCAAAAWLAPRIVGTMDWNSILQKLTVAIICTTVFLVLSNSLTSHASKRASSLVLLIVLTVCAYGASAITARRLQKSESGSAMEQYGASDLEFSLSRELLQSPFEDEAHAEFYAFLRQNTNIRNNVEPPRIDLVQTLVRTPGAKPDIFIFVIDSLRKDYLSPYNPAVHFTPKIDSFARESVVMQNAFTRYGGTAMAEPSIWVGGMLLHEAYPSPFYPINNLEKLIETNGYVPLVTVDDVLKSILKPLPESARLDRDAKYWTENDLCRTTREIEQRMDSRADKAPIFVYTQSQNIHTVTLFRLGNKRPPQKSYAGFNRRYASELERLDAGFGDFIDYLKRRGEYDNSIVILTSDHGDQFGEMGREGHSSTLFPHVIRIPLVVHLPLSLRSTLNWDEHELAFSTDITPSLYYILGQGPLLNSEVFGRPLFTETAAERQPYMRANYLLVSSYGPTYGILSDKGRKLFISDASARANYFYDLASDPEGLRNGVNKDIFAASAGLIRKFVEEIGNRYGYQLRR